MSRGIHSSRTRFCALLATLAAALCALAGTSWARGRSLPCPNADTHPDATNGVAIDEAIVCLIDQLRSEHGLPRLRVNTWLRAVAASQVKEMVRRDYFADDRLSGVTPLALISYSRYAAHDARVLTGQNLGWGTGVDATPASMVSAWINSIPHREIMLTAAFRDVGVGVVATVPSVLQEGITGATYAVEFAAHLPGERPPGEFETVTIGSAPTSEP